jgi:hypothetical protein
MWSNAKGNGSWFTPDAAVVSALDGEGIITWGEVV